MTKHQYRQGDRVSVEGVIDHVFDGSSDLEIKVRVGHHDIYLRADQITMVSPDLKPGDVVKGPHRVGAARQGTIMAINGDLLWVEVIDGKMETWSRGEVTRAVADPTVVTINGPVDEDTMARLRAAGPGSVILEADPHAFGRKVGSGEGA